MKTFTGVLVLLLGIALLSFLAAAMAFRLPLADGVSPITPMLVAATMVCVGAGCLIDFRGHKVIAR